MAGEPCYAPGHRAAAAATAAASAAIDTPDRKSLATKVGFGIAAAANEGGQRIEARSYQRPRPDDATAID